MADRTAERPTATEAAATKNGAVETVEQTDDVLVVEDLLVEEVSIDGMCGVY